MLVIICYSGFLAEYYKFHDDKETAHNNSSLKVEISLVLSIIVFEHMHAA